MNRDAKKLAKQQRLLLLHKRHAERCAQSLEPIGLAEWFRSLSGEIKELLWAECIAEPVIVINGSAPATCDVLRNAVQEVLRASTVEVRGIPISQAEIWTVLLPLLCGLSSAGVTCPNRPLASLSKTAAAACNDHYSVIYEQAMEQLSFDLFVVSLAHTRIGRQVVSYRIDTTTCPIGKQALRITLGVLLCQPTDVHVDGSNRRAYRCVGPGFKQSHRWVTWPASVLGDHGSAAEYPVYIQQHAIDRLDERLPAQSGGVHYSLFCSLNRPVIIDRQGDDLWVEYRLLDKYRLGYLVVQQLPDKVLVKTFLFLTMHGTPEARKLRQRLKLCRPDIEYQELDKLETYAFTDLRQDADLVRIINECGCGSLLDVVDTLQIDDYQSPRGYARALKEYLCLTKARL